MQSLRASRAPGASESKDGASHDRKFETRRGPKLGIVEARSLKTDLAPENDDLAPEALRGARSALPGARSALPGARSALPVSSGLFRWLPVARSARSGGKVGLPVARSAFQGQGRLFGVSRSTFWGCKVAISGSKVGLSGSRVGPFRRLPAASGGFTWGARFWWARDSYDFLSARKGGTVIKFLALVVQNAIVTQCKNGHGNQ